MLDDTTLRSGPDLATNDPSGVETARQADVRRTKGAQGLDRGLQPLTFAEVMGLMQMAHT